MRAGEAAPEFELRDHKGQLITLSERLVTGPVVLFFYPKDGTPG